MATNVSGDSARLFPWQMVHYLVHGGPNDPSTPSFFNPPGSADGGYLSAWNTNAAGVTALNFITVPPVPGSQTPPAVPLPRSQMIYAGSAPVGGFAAALTSVTPNTPGGVLLGTIPKGSWIESIEMYVYSAFSATTGTIHDIGIFYAPANTVSTSGPGYQPGLIFPLAFLTGGGTAGTLYSSEGANGARVAFTGPTGGTTNLGEGPGLGTTVNTAGQLASMSDIDVYFCVFGLNTSGSTAASTGSAAVRIKFTGLEG